MSEPIQLYVYDLSNGMAATFGRQLTGKAIEGIWHTSLVLYGREVFYGQGISIAAPGSTHHGVPNHILPMGTTSIDQDTFFEYIEGMKQVYLAERYHLLEFNCNSFTNEVLTFLNGNSIPDYIRNLPAEIMSTPFGQQMRPMIDQMFSGRSGPSASDAVQAIIPSTRVLNTISNNPTPIPHPHSQLALPALTKLSRSLTPIRYSSLPAIPALVTKISQTLDCAMMTSDDKTSIATTKSILVAKVIPFLATLPDPSRSSSVSSSSLSTPNSTTSSSALPHDLMVDWITATRSSLDILSTEEWFPFVDLWRVGLSRDISRLDSAIGKSSGGHRSLLETIVVRTNELEDEAMSRGLLLTVLRLISNALASNVLAAALLEKESQLRDGMTKLVIRSLLHEDKLARSTGAGLVFGVIGRVCSKRTAANLGSEYEEDWEIEMASAILEGLNRERESIEVVHRLIASLGVLLLNSPHHESLCPLLEALGAKDTLSRKQKLIEGKLEVVDIIREVEQML